VENGTAHNGIGLHRTALNGPTGTPMNARTVVNTGPSDTSQTTLAVWGSGVRVPSAPPTEAPESGACSPSTVCSDGSRWSMTGASTLWWSKWGHGNAPVFSVVDDIEANSAAGLDGD